MHYGGKGGTEMMRISHAANNSFQARDCDRRAEWIGIPWLVYLPRLWLAISLTLTSVKTRLVPKAISTAKTIATISTKGNEGTGRCAINAYHPDFSIAITDISSWHATANRESSHQHQYWHISTTTGWPPRLFSVTHWLLSLPVPTLKQHGSIQNNLGSHCVSF